MNARHVIRSGRRKDVPPVEQRPVKYPDTPEFPVDVLPPALRDLIDSTNLDPAMLAAFGLAAMATAAGRSSLVVGDSPDLVRPVLWLPIIAEASDGKSPALRAATRVLSNLERAARDEWRERGEDDARPANRLVGDTTIEALARLLDAYPQRGILLDELTTLLNGVGAYKQNGRTSDWPRWLSLWAGASWAYTRVGRGRKEPEIDVVIDDPVVTVAGCLVPVNVARLGTMDDGSIPRWLPFRARTEPGMQGDDREAKQFDAAIERAYLGGPTTWRLDGQALRTWRAAAERWKADRSQETNQYAQSALGKADAQALRLALVLAEFTDTDGSEVTVETMRAAVDIVEYCLDVWGTLDSYEKLTLTQVEDKLWRASVAVHDVAAKHAKGKLTAREVLQQHIASIRDRDTLDDVAGIYEQHWKLERRVNGAGDVTAMWFCAEEVAE